jgi:hypothetical protein
MTPEQCRAIAEVWDNHKEDAERQIRRFPGAPDNSIWRQHAELCRANCEAYIAAAKAAPKSPPADAIRMLDKFTSHFAPWMNHHSDETESGTFSRHTFGDLREARAIVERETKRV